MDNKQQETYRDMAESFAPLYNKFVSLLPDCAEADLARERLTEARLWFAEALVTAGDTQEDQDDIEVVDADVV